MGGYFFRFVADAVSYARGTSSMRRKSKTEELRKVADGSVAL